jgi:hypothetical protein
MVHPDDPKSLADFFVWQTFPVLQTVWRSNHPKPKVWRRFCKTMKVCQTFRQDINNSDGPGSFFFHFSGHPGPEIHLTTWVWQTFVFSPDCLETFVVWLVRFQTSVTVHGSVIRKSGRLLYFLSPFPDVGYSSWVRYQKGYSSWDRYQKVWQTFVFSQSVSRRRLQFMGPLSESLADFCIFSVRLQTSVTVHGSVNRKSGRLLYFLSPSPDVGYSSWVRYEKVWQTFVFFSDSPADFCVFLSGSPDVRCFFRLFF